MEGMVIGFTKIISLTNGSIAKSIELFCKNVNLHFQDLKIVPFVIRFFIKILHYLRKLAQHVQTNSMQLVYINGSRVRVVQLVHFVDQHSISEGREGFKGNFYKMYFSTYKYTCKYTSI